MQKNPETTADKPIGLFTFTETAVTGVPKVFPVYDNGANYEYFTHSVTNFDSLTVVFCIRLSKSTKNVVVYHSSNNGTWAPFGSFTSSYTELV